MRRKNIEKKIQEKFNSWVQTIEDKDVQSLVWQNSIVTGGCIVSMLLDEPVNDYDIYFTNKETALSVAKYYTTKYGKVCDNYVSIIDCAKEHKENLLGTIDDSRVYINCLGISKYKATPEEIENKTEFLPKAFTTNAITLDNDIQLIIRFHGDPKEIHSNFDFVHATCYWTSDNNKLTLPAEALESILTKQLIYRGSKYPFSSIVRTKKFLLRGWNIGAGEYLKMVLQLNFLDLTDINVFADQVLGVDTMYFVQLIEKIKESIEENENPMLENSIIMKMVDEVFN